MDKRSLHTTQKEVTYHDMEEENTLNDTLTPSLQSEDENRDMSLVHSSPSRKQPPMSVSLHDANDESELSVSSMGEEDQPYDPLVCFA